MSLSLPSESEIRAKAEQLELLEPGADLPPRVRRQVASLLVTEKRDADLAAAAAPPGVLLSRYSTEVPDGRLQVDVVFIPNPPKPKDPTDG